MDDDMPPLVRQAYVAARRIGFALTAGESTGTGSACLPGTGRFLAMLAAGCSRIGELGTGAGIGAAWMASAMPADCTLVTAEIDPRRAAAAREVFADDLRVTVITGESFPVISQRGPYDLLFSDGGGGQAGLVDLLTIGGRVVMDDVTPTALLPPGSPFLSADDPKRRFFASPRLVSTEIVLPDLRHALLVGTRTSALGCGAATGIAT
jgi:predicted O-methyltransferase YrrM